MTRTDYFLGLQNRKFVFEHERPSNAETLQNEYFRFVRVLNRVPIAEYSPRENWFPQVADFRKLGFQTSTYI